MDTSNINNFYTGYKHLYLNDNEIASLYQQPTNTVIQCLNPNDFKENEYAILHEAESLKVIKYLKFRNGDFVDIKYPIIDNNFTGCIKPRNSEQYIAMDMLTDNRVPVKLITGKFGSGKTLLCITAALDAIEKGKFDKIIFVRNNVQVKDTDNIGSLPGNELDKTLPYVMPFADHCGGVEGVMTLIEEGKLEVIPLAFLRGRSIKNAILYSMESENLTKEHIQLILGRIDEGSELWMDGDIKQRDKVVFEKSKGLEVMISRLSGNSLFGYVHLDKSERSEVSALADLLD